MPVDRDALKLPFESVSTEEGLHARFHEDGQLAYLGLYRDGQVQMEVEVSPVLGTGVSRRSLNFEFQAELPKGLQDQLEDWTRAKVAEIEDASGGALHCDFCRRHADEVARLIEGPNLYICNECVHLCVAIMSQEPED
jgi:hypothetical protein